MKDGARKAEKEAEAETQRLRKWGRRGLEVRTFNLTASDSEITQTCGMTTWQGRDSEMRPQRHCFKSHRPHQSAARLLTRPSAHLCPRGLVCTPRSPVGAQRCSWGNLRAHPGRRREGAQGRLTSVFQKGGPEFQH